MLADGTIMPHRIGHLRYGSAVVEVCLYMVCTWPYMQRCKPPMPPYHANQSRVEIGGDNIASA